MKETLLQALLGGSVVPYYQPLVKPDGTRSGFEALARWVGETSFFNQNNLFTEIQRNGLAWSLWECMLGAACRDLEKIEKTNRTHVSVNIGADIIEEARVIDLIEKKLGEHDLRPDEIWIEITETEAIGNPQKAAVTVKKLRENGIKVCLDDFNTGHSGPGYLQRFEVDIIKIDQSFVKGLPKDRVSRAVVKSTISLAHELGLEVVAEGVETLEQKNILADYGADYLQGFLLGRPTPVMSI